jgi:hypothetical protein
MVRRKHVARSNLHGDLFQSGRTMRTSSRFQLICINCDALGIVLDYPDNAPSSTQIKCQACEAPRGTIGALRNLALSDRRDLFDADEPTLSG